jgi:hypothetical protein
MVFAAKTLGEAMPLYDAVSSALAMAAVSQHPAHGSAPGGPRAGAPLATWRFSDHRQGTAKGTADRPRAPKGIAPQSVLTA